MKWNYLVLKVLGRTTGGFVNCGLKKFGIFGYYFGTEGFIIVGRPITDKYRYWPIYRLSADISVLPINKMLIGIGYRYWPIRRVISAG